MRNEQAEPGTKRSLLCPPRGRRCPWPRSLAASAIGLIGVLAVNFAALVLSLKVGALLGLQPGMPVRRPGTGALLLLTEGMVCPVIEEILFRGFILKIIQNRFGFMTGNTIQALIFGLMHGIPFGLVTKNVAAFFLLTLIPGLFGWYQGWLNEKECRGSIIPSWLLHGCINLLTAILSL